MSPRRNRPQGGLRPASADEGVRFGVERTEIWQDEEWVVRQIGGSAAAKHYRCPGCDQEIPPGVAHLVTWARDGRVDDRRHWHRACWNAKDRRTTRVQRSRNAPRF